MRRFVRHVFTIISTLLLLLCVAACVLWVRSRGAGDSIGWMTFKTQAVQYGEYREETSRFTSFLGLESRNGCLAVGFARSTMFKTTPAIFAKQWDSVPDADREFRWTTLARQTRPFQFECRRSSVHMGFLVADSAGPGTDRKLILQVPYWSVVLVTAAITAIHVLNVARRRRQRRKGLCAACGYDLRASPDRCPECGTPVEAKGAVT